MLGYKAVLQWLPIKVVALLQVMILKKAQTTFGITRSLEKLDALKDSKYE